MIRHITSKHLLSVRVILRSTF